MLLPPPCLQLQDVCDDNIVACLYLLQHLASDRPTLRALLLQAKSLAVREGVQETLTFLLKRVGSFERQGDGYSATPLPIADDAGAAPTGQPAPTAADKAGDATAAAPAAPAAAEAAPAPAAADTEDKFIAPAGQSVAAFIDTLLAMIPDAAANPQRCDNFFELLLSFANLSEAERAILVRRSVIGRLVDFMICDDSPHPELNGAPALPVPEEDAVAAGAAAGDRPTTPDAGTGAGGGAGASTGRRTPRYGPVAKPRPAGKQARRSIGAWRVPPSFDLPFALLRVLVRSGFEWFGCVAKFGFAHFGNCLHTYRCLLPNPPQAPMWRAPTNFDLAYHCQLSTEPCSHASPSATSWLARCELDSSARASR